MSVTYGFYNARNHDRKYDAVQVSSMFDGIIKDGIYMSIGDRLDVRASSGMVVTVGTGRAWFNHTWTLNDALLPVELPLSEVILDRVDAVVLEVNAAESVRANAIKVVKGKPATNNPSRPAMTNTDTVHQYPLAYVSVRAGVAEIRQADITGMVGTSAAPFVTGVMQTMNIDSLVAQWEDQWAEWFGETQHVLAAAENGELLEEVRRLYCEMYKVAKDGDIDRIIAGRHVDDDDDSSIFEVASNGDIDDIIGNAYAGEPETDETEQEMAGSMRKIVNDAFAGNGG